MTLFLFASPFILGIILGLLSVGLFNTSKAVASLWFPIICIGFYAYSLSYHEDHGGLSFLGILMIGGLMPFVAAISFAVTFGVLTLIGKLKPQPVKKEKFDLYQELPTGAYLLFLIFAIGLLIYSIAPVFTSSR